MSKVGNYIDRIILNRLIGFPIFLFVIYCMFFCSICFGGAFQQFFDITSKALFIDLPSYLLIKISAPIWLQNILSYGVGSGINVTLTFIPVSAGMFFFLSFLEHSGYITRAAFIMNSFMRYLGLPGKSFIPMLMGFGCNVSAVLSTKILPRKQERILTTLMIPFISCGAKLAIYAVFVTAFFSASRQNIVFLLYLIGILIAIFTGVVFKKFLISDSDYAIQQQFSSLKLPKLSIVLKSTIQQLKTFLLKAGSIIIPICVVISILGNIQTNNSNSILELIGKKMTPIFKPIGIQEDNWPAVVGLISGVVSKEVIVGTLATLYERNNVQGNTKMPNSVFLPAEGDKQENIVNNLFLSIQQGLWSIPNNLINLKKSFLSPFTINSEQKLNNNTLGAMCLKFNNSVAAFSYLLFILLYCPCISVLAVIMRELGIKWALFTMIWTTSIAYIVSLVFYQVFARGNIFSIILWGGAGIVIFLGVVFLVKRYFLYKDNNHRLIPTKVV